MLGDVSWNKPKLLGYFSEWQLQPDMASLIPLKINNYDLDSRFGSTLIGDSPHHHVWLFGTHFGTFVPSLFHRAVRRWSGNSAEDRTVMDNNNTILRVPRGY